MVGNSNRIAAPMYSPWWATPSFVGSQRPHNHRSVASMGRPSPRRRHGRRVPPGRDQLCTRGNSGKSGDEGADGLLTDHICAIVCLERALESKMDGMGIAQREILKLSCCLFCCPFWRPNG